jgi:hypothetical protein
VKLDNKNSVFSDAWYHLPVRITEMYQIQVIFRFGFRYVSVVSNKTWLKNVLFTASGYKIRIDKFIQCRELFHNKFKYK